MRISATTVMMPEFDLRETAELLVKLGFDGAEWRCRQIPEGQRDRPYSPWGNVKNDLSPDNIAVRGGELMAASEELGLAVAGLATNMGADELDEVRKVAEACAKWEIPLFRVGAPRSYKPDENYRTLVASCLADKHKILAESPLDINIAKQVNILASDVGFSLEDIVIFPTTAALGYGLEYVYSIMVRSRLAALTGDKLLQQPVLCTVGFEAWRAKEARGSDEEVPGFGPAEKRGPLWEAATATNLFQAGADIFVMRHPEAIKIVGEFLDEYYGPRES